MRKRAVGLAFLRGMGGARVEVFGRDFAPTLRDLLFPYTQKRPLRFLSVVFNLISSLTLPASRSGE